MAGLRRDLPEGVSDIDQDDLDNPQLCAEYAPVFILGDCVAVLFRLIKASEMYT